MSRAFFSAAERRALDSFAVPPLSAGFADRVVRRALAEAPLASAPRDPMSVRRYRSAWTRSGRRIGVFVAFSVLSAAAAALGLFGEPGRLPLIGELIAGTAAEAPAAPRSAPIERLAAAEGETRLGAPPAGETGPAPAASKTTRAERFVSSAPAMASTGAQPEPGPPPDMLERSRRPESPVDARDLTSASRLTLVEEGRDPPRAPLALDEAAQRPEALVRPENDAARLRLADAVELPSETAVDAAQRARAELRRRSATNPAARPGARDVAQQRRTLRQRRR